MNITPLIYLLFVSAPVLFFLGLRLLQNRPARSLLGWDDRIMPTGIQAEVKREGVDGIMETVVVVGQRSLTPASVKKIEVLTALIGLLHNDDVDKVFVDTVGTMTRLDYKFKGDAYSLINQIERDCR